MKKIASTTLVLLFALGSFSSLALAQSDSLNTPKQKPKAIYSVADLYSLRPTYQMELDHYFTDNAKLIECNTQLIQQIKKVKALKEYKYFETNGGFGIISDIQTVKDNPSDEGTATKRNFFERLFGIGNSTLKYKRVYIFLLIKNGLNEEIVPNYDFLNKTYRNRELERKWANITTLNQFLNNPENKYNPQQHSFVMRVYEFKKGQLAEGFEFIPGDNGYKIDPKVAELFHP
jgi:hypothetical protein